MAVREVLRYPHPALKQVAAEASAEDTERVGADLVDTMRSFPRCVGIAAPQLGELVRVVDSARVKRRTRGEALDAIAVEGT